MIMAQINFGSCCTGDEHQEGKSLVEEYLGTLQKNGQIYGEYVLGYQKNALTAFVYLADIEALIEQSHSEMGKKRLELLIKHFES